MHLRQTCFPLALLSLALAACAERAEEVPTASSAPSLSVGPSPLGPPLAVGVELVASGLTSPVQLVQAPGRSGRRFVVDQVGLVRTLNPSGKVLPTPFLDLSDRITPLNPGYDERGLLGLAFHPEFDRNGRFFVFYTIPPRPGAPAGYDHTNVVSEFRARGVESTHADPGSERIVLQVDHPQGNHNGGTIAFGPDGYLYVSIGDGGGRDDEGLGHVDDWYEANAGGNGQDLEHNLLGNVLRIDVDGAHPYAVPADNPFVGRPGLDEVWAYGFRNPYRFSFDMGGSHALLVGDAGQELWEEVSRVVKGGNYGWNVKEGTHCFDAENPTVVPEDCPEVDPTTGEPLRDPVIEFANTKNPVGGLALTVVGGHVYRGSRVPALAGMYVFGGATASFTAPDGRLFAAAPQASGLWPMRELLIDGTDRLGHVVKGFGQDLDGEVYVLASEILGPTGSTGKVFRLVRPGG
ncbi:MAG TPA: PQQ-dependent sugar dehydrogenase [Longimicrobiaceae bacterium]|nr:PQQ-dependent sugar dehydrogenase [Longimicrobiaceae bacterium]